MVELVAALLQIRLDAGGESGVYPESEVVKAQRRATHRLTALIGESIKGIVAEFEISEDRQEMAECYREIMGEEDDGEMEREEEEEEEEKEEE